jgi:hypothetical protein
VKRTIYEAFYYAIFPIPPPLGPNIPLSTQSSNTRSLLLTSETKFHTRTVRVRHFTVPVLCIVHKDGFVTALTSVVLEQRSLGRDAVQSGRCRPTLRNNVLPPSSRPKNTLTKTTNPGRMQQAGLDFLLTDPEEYVPPKRR